eukprot:11447386-Heterocapsa_arctica.AAC.1
MADTTTNCEGKLCIKSKTRSECNKMMDTFFDTEKSTAIMSYVEEQNTTILGIQQRTSSEGLHTCDTV